MATPCLDTSHSHRLGSVEMTLRVRESRESCPTCRCCPTTLRGRRPSCRSAPQRPGRTVGAFHRAGCCRQRVASAIPRPSWLAGSHTVRIPYTGALQVSVLPSGIVWLGRAHGKLDADEVAQFLVLSRLTRSVRLGPGSTTDLRDLQIGGRRVVNKTPVASVDIQYFRLRLKGS
jgi:hypothetical protein